MVPISVCELGLQFLFLVGQQSLWRTHRSLPRGALLLLVLMGPVCEWIIHRSQILSLGPIRLLHFTSTNPPQKELSVF